MANLPKHLMPKKNKLGGQKNIKQKPKSCQTRSRKSSFQPQKKDTVSGSDGDDPDASSNPLLKIRNYDYDRLAINLSKAIGVIINPVVERHNIYVEERQKI